MSELSRSISTDTAGTRRSPAQHHRARVWWILALVIAAVACGGAIWAARSNGVGDPESLPTAVVERGPLIVSITEDGEVKAEKQQIITNDLRWPVIIEEVHPEGKVIEKDQTVIRLKCEELMDTIEEQELRLQAADNEHNASATNYDIKKMQLDARVRKAEQAVEDAVADLTKYKEALWAQQQEDAKAKIQLAERDLKLAEHKLQSKLKINADPELNTPYSQNEIDAEKLSVDRLKLALKKARTELDILEQYTHPRELRDRTGAVEDAKLVLTSARAERDKQLSLAETDRESSAFRLRKQRERLKQHYEDRDTKLNVKAKQSGLVVYETRRRPWHRPITVAEGEKINPRQQLIIIPDRSTLVVKTHVYEAVREKVRVGLAARIRLDARPGLVMSGKVTKVASLPDSQNPWLSPGVKVYPTTVIFDDLKTLELKPGMSCNVEIDLAELEDAVSVPIASVFSDDEVTYCYRVREGRRERVNIKIGLTSESRVQVVSGLEPGDRVLLVPPPGEKIGRRKKPKPRPASMPAGIRNGNGAEAQGSPSTQPADRHGPSTRPGRGRRPEEGAATRPARRREGATSRAGARRGRSTAQGTP